MLRMCSTTEPHLSLQAYVCLAIFSFFHMPGMITQMGDGCFEKSHVSHFLPGGRWPALLPGPGKAGKLALNIRTNMSFLFCHDIVFLSWLLKWYILRFGFGSDRILFQLTVGRDSFISDLTLNIRHLYWSLWPKLILIFFFKTLIGILYF